MQNVMCVDERKDGITERLVRGQANGRGLLLLLPLVGLKLGTLYYSRGPSRVPFARYSACEIVGHIWEQPVVAVCRVVPVAAIVPVIPAGTYRAIERPYCS